MTIIYIVNSGCYSDFGYDGVFSTKANALAFMRAYPKDGYGGYNDIVEMELDKHVSDIERGLVLWNVFMCTDGEVLDVKHSDDPTSGMYEGRWWHDTFRGKKLDKRWTSFYCTAKDEKSAIKIANEKRIQALATMSAKP